METAGIRSAREAIENFKKAEPTAFNRSSLRYWRNILRIEERKVVERDAFELWYCEDAARQGHEFPDGITHLRDGDQYGPHRHMLNGKWEGWKARSAIAYTERT